MFEKGQLIEFEITDVSDRGQGIGKADGIAVFVDGGVIGDVVQAEVTKVKKRFCFGKVVENHVGERKHYDTFFERYVPSSYLRNGKTAAPGNRRIFWLVGCHIGHGNRCSISRCIRCV